MSVPTPLRLREHRRRKKENQEHEDREKVCGRLLSGYSTSHAAMSPQQLEWLPALGLYRIGSVSGQSQIRESLLLPGGSIVLATEEPPGSSRQLQTRCHTEGPG